MEYLCSTCDMEAHKRNVFHDREAVFHGFLEPIPPTTAVVVNENGQPQFCEQICQLPVPAPRSICECTHDFTITPGKHISVVTINGRYDVCLPRKSCSSCSAEWTPEVKDLLTYRYWPASTSCQTLYKFDVFTSFEHMKVTAPAMSRQAFLKMLEHRSVQAGRANESAVCGTAKFTAGREMSKKSGAQIDEEGIQVAVCRHGFLLRGLNHYRGEIFAYPMFLQREMSKKANVTFFCMDVTCRYWPYLNKVAEGLPELLPLTEMRPFLSVMHAKAHTAKCEVLALP
ncbi:THAP domain-containing 6 [Labeo rohita]|uniref:THAP domain-containing 6 n=1 Tax=Labeo rohita TaxID=84645 RepID=A0A498NY16_LABRO|nr:THAP domain-containing 6 [Labeo rohita]